MSDKTKLEDLTLKQICKLKEGYQIRVAEALTAIQNEFMEKYDCGIPLVDIYTETKDEVFYTEAGVKIIASTSCEYHIEIRFSKEDD